MTILIILLLAILIAIFTPYIIYKIINKVSRPPKQPALPPKEEPKSISYQETLEKTDKDLGFTDIQRSSNSENLFKTEIVFEFPTFTHSKPIMDYASEQAKRQKLYLYKKFGSGKYGDYNRDRIDYVINSVYKPQLKTFNKSENKVRQRLKLRGLNPHSQQIIPIQSEGGKLEHLYIADFVVGKTIIEVDGPQHSDQIEWDQERDRLTSNLGYTTIRIPTTDLSDNTIDSYLKDLY